MKIGILGTGFIARFYAETLTSQRRKDEIVFVYSRSEDNAKRFCVDYKVKKFSTSMDQCIGDDEVDVVIIALPNHLHHAAVLACAANKKAVLCTKPLGRTAIEAKEMLDAVEKAGVFAGYLEDLCYTPKFLKSVDSVRLGNIGKVLWTKSREAHPGPHSDWFWDKNLSGGGAIIDLACHCVEIGRNFIGKDILPIDVMCWSATQVHPIEAEDHAVGLVRYSNGALSQFEVSWTFRGGMDLRDEVIGTEGSIWLNSFLRTGFEMFSTGKGGYVAEKAEVNKGWLFPVGDEAHELGYTNMFTDMFDSLEQGKTPKETFYDGYIVNAILDAAFKSSLEERWVKIDITDWRGSDAIIERNALVSFDEFNFLVKEEILPNGDTKVILRNKVDGSISQRQILAV